MMASIGVALLLITVGIYELVTGQLMTNVLEFSLRKPLESLNRQDISQPLPESDGVQVDEAAPDTSCCEPTAVVLDTESNTTAQNTTVQGDTTHAPAVAYTEVFWQDDFTSTSSGWEPYFEITGELPVYQSIYAAQSQSNEFSMNDVYYTTANATAWNGYDNGNYSFTLPGAPMARDSGYGTSIAKYLWDYNLSQPLPSYPYLVDVSADTSLGTGAIVVLDFSGDVNNVSAGHGILVMIPTKKDMGVTSEGVLNEQLHVLEFADNRLWELKGCESSDEHVYYPSSQIRAQFVVDQTRLFITIKGANSPEYTVTCNRALNGDDSTIRLLGIGSRFWNLNVPVPHANVLRFHDVVIAQPNDISQYTTAYSTDNTISEVRDASCDPFVEDSIDVSLDTYLTGSCFDAVVWVTDPNPYGTRVAWPAQGDIFGRWQCGVEPFANFEIYPEQDVATITMSGLSYRVIAVNGYTEYPFMVVHIPWGSNYEQNTMHAEAQIGDSVYSPSRIWYGLKLNSDGSLQTSWMTPPCYRVN
jgi:hypothetical protein